MEYPNYFAPVNKGAGLYGGGQQQFDKFVDNMLVGGAMNNTWKETLAIIILIFAALNWLVVLINYEVNDVQAGEFGGLVPDSIASLFRIPPDGINKAAGTDNAKTLDACQGIQAFVYALVGLAVIVAVMHMMDSGSSAMFKVGLVVLMIGALNWVVTLINMYVFDVQSGGASGYAPDLVFLGSKLAGPDTMKMDPYPGGDVDQDQVKAVKITQEVLYGIVGLVGVAMIVQHFRKP